MSILAAAISSSALPLSPNLILCFIIIICYKLFPKIIPRSIMYNYIIPTAAHFKWAWDFLLHHSLFPNSPHNMNIMPENCGIRLYEPEPLGSKEEAECAVCLCKIEGGEEIRELTCSHMFHRECLDRWVGHRNNNGTCPLCRGCIAPSRMANEVGEEVIVFKFYSFSSSATNRSTWWLR